MRSILLKIISISQTKHEVISNVSKSIIGRSSSNKKCQFWHLPYVWRICIYARDNCTVQTNQPKFTQIQILWKINKWHSIICIRLKCDSGKTAFVQYNIHLAVLSCIYRELSDWWEHRFYVTQDRYVWIVCIHFSLRLFIFTVCLLWH